MGRQQLDPITPHDWIDLIDLVCSPTSGLWPGEPGKPPRAWKTAEDHYHQFEQFPENVIRGAILALFDEGNQNPPSLSKLKARCKTLAADLYGEYALTPDMVCDHPNKGVLPPIPPGKVVVRCANPDCDWEEETGFDTLADYHAHYDRLEQEARAAHHPAARY